MSSILYYSNFCEHSKKLLQSISKANISKDIHFICIDKRIKDSNNKIYIILENGQKIIMPENISRVPALLLLNQNYQVLYGEAIVQYVKKATQNNLEPMAFAFGGSGGSFGSITSDHYSFLDMDADSLSAKGNGGVRQMHNYVDLNYSDNISTPEDEQEYKTAGKISGDLTVEKLLQQREQDLQKLTANKPPLNI